MIDLEDQLKPTLTAVADSTPVPAFPSGAQYRAVARRRPVFMAPVLAAAAASVLILAGLVVAAHTGSSRTPSQVPGAPPAFASWPARGALANDASLATDAMATWEAAPVPARELPHRDVRVLYATRTAAGDSVVLAGQDGFGRTRIAWLNTDPTSRTPFRHRLHLVADVFAPTGSASRLLVLYAPRPTTQPDTDHALIALAAPGTARLQWNADWFHGWRDLAVTDGAAIELTTSSNPGPNVSVRLGSHGDGAPALDDVFDMPPVIEIAHDLDRQEFDDSSSNQTCHDGQCTVTINGGSSSGILSPAPDGTWSDLRQVPMQGNGNAPNGDWPEFAPEIRLLTATLHPAGNGGGMYQAAYSTLLPDGTGIYAFGFTPPTGPSRFLMYVDRPEWHAGRAADVDATDPIPALAVLVPVGGAQRLVALVSDGLRIQWAVDGHTWHDTVERNHVATAAIPTADAGRVRWKALNVSGEVVVASSLPIPTVSR